MKNLNKFNRFTLSLILFVFISTIILPSYGEETPKTDSPIQITVTIQPPNVGTPFDPQEVRITPNSTVTWINNDNVTHTVTSGSPQQGSDGIFDSGLLHPGKKFSRTFTKIGTFHYYCQVHPTMTGTITVNANTIPEFPVGHLILAIGIMMTFVLYRLMIGATIRK